MMEEGGDGCLITSMLVVIVLRFRVSIIILAKPITIVMIIPREMNPPVSVLYSI